MNKKTAQILIGALAAIAFIGIAASEWLGRDCDTCISGWEVLKAEGRNFWISNIILSVVGVGLVWGFMFIYKKQRDFGAVRKLLIAGVLFLCFAWLRACEDKAEGTAVTTEKGRNLPKVDDGRQAAEDMIK